MEEREAVTRRGSQGGFCKAKPSPPGCPVHPGYQSWMLLSEGEHFEVNKIKAEMTPFLEGLKGGDPHPHATGEWAGYHWHLAGLNPHVWRLGGDFQPPAFRVPGDTGHSLCIGKNLSLRGHPSPALPCVTPLYLDINGRERPTEEET